MVTRHTGIPMMRFRGAYPPCSPAVYIAADVNPFCAGETVTFTPTLVCLDDAVSYSWIVESVEVSTSSSPYSTNTLVGGNRVILKVVNSLGQSIYSNMIIVQEKTEGCPTEIKYGLLYNWYAATDARLLCADGWTIPTVAQWETLQAYLGGLSVAGGKLKEIGTIYWTTPNSGATNEVGFNGRGSGRRSGPTGGTFDVSLGGQAYFWTPYFSGTCSVFALSYNDDNFGVAFRYKADGISVRLIKTTTAITHGQTGIYTGNDGKVYRTICIGTQEWLADNLAETKYRNGDYIHGYEGGSYQAISNAAWANLTDSALCAYNNDLNNV